MDKLILGATLTLGLPLSANTASIAAPGDGLDPNASATSNSSSYRTWTGILHIA